MIVNGFCLSENLTYVDRVTYQVVDTMSPPWPGSSFGGSSKATNIFAAALSNVSTGGGIFGSTSSSSSSGLNKICSCLSALKVVLLRC